MNIGIVFFTDNGKKICDKILDSFSSQNIHSFEIRDKKEKLSDWTKRCFREKDGIIFISATGIAVRSIASNIVSKTKDPAVLVIDDMGNYVISLLSGHVGGANKLALDIAKTIGGEPVITTATDVSGKLAIDAWAVENKLIIDDIKPAKDIAMNILSDEPIYVKSDVKISSDNKNIVFLKDVKKEVSLGINISFRKTKYFEKELKLIPKIVTLGIGCRRGKSKEDIKKLVDFILQEENIDIRSIKNIASIDLKKDEKGLLALVEEMNVDFITFTKDELEAVRGDFPKSDFVKNITGVDNVCQRSAVLASKNGNVLVKKIARDGVTLSVAVEDMKLSM